MRLIHGDCLHVLSTLPDASVDAVVTDPPAGISFMGKEWDANKGGRGPWTNWLTGIMAEALRVARPGAYALVWALPRTSHWTATALDDAGWCIQDVITHHFGTGFPKHKSSLKPGSEHWILAYRPGKRALQVDACRIGSNTKKWETPRGGIWATGPTGSVKKIDTGYGRWPANVIFSHHPDCAKQGTKRVTGNVQSTTRGALGFNGGVGQQQRNTGYADPDGTEEVESWDCVEGCPVAELDRQSGVSTSTVHNRGIGLSDSTVYGAGQAHWTGIRGQADIGTASRFFYVSKASKRDRSCGGQVDNTHPTVKSTDLMRYLCRLVTPPGGTLLDPFAGSGSTLLAAHAEGFDAIGIEQDAASIAIATARLATLQPSLFAAAGE